MQFDHPQGQKIIRIFEYRISLIEVQWCVYEYCVYIYIHICKRYETESLLHLDTLLQDDDRIWLRQAAAARIQACYQGRMVREATRWPRWMIYRGMDWFVGDNLNRIFPWRSWGFPWFSCKSSLKPIHWFPGECWVMLGIHWGIQRRGHHWIPFWTRKTGISWTELKDFDMKWLDMNYPLVN